MEEKELREVFSKVQVLLKESNLDVKESISVLTFIISKIIEYDTGKNVDETVSYIGATLLSIYRGIKDSNNSN